MSYHFEIDHLREILEDCPEFRPNHHLGRPFMSSYQIAIRFAERYPQHPAVIGLEVGGIGVGEHDSLTKQIGRFLSQELAHNPPEGIEGGFISHECRAKIWFLHGDREIEASTSPNPAHSIFRSKK